MFNSSQDFHEKLKKCNAIYSNQKYKCYSPLPPPNKKNYEKIHRS